MSSPIRSTLPLRSCIRLANASRWAGIARLVDAIVAFPAQFALDFHNQIRTDARLDLAHEQSFAAFDLRPVADRVYLVQRCPAEMVQVRNFPVSSSRKGWKAPRP